MAGCSAPPGEVPPWARNGCSGAIGGGWGAAGGSDANRTVAGALIGRPEWSGWESGT